MLHFDVINNRTTCVHHSTAKTIAQVLMFNIIRIVYEEIQLRSYIRVPSCWVVDHKCIIEESQPYTYRQPLYKSFVISKTFGKQLPNQLRNITVCPMLDPTRAGEGEVGTGVQRFVFKDHDVRCSEMHRELFARVITATACIANGFCRSAKWSRWWIGFRLISIVAPSEEQ